MDAASSPSPPLLPGTHTTHDLATQRPAPTPPAQDNIREQDPGLRSLSLKEFCALIFEAVPGLEHWRGSLEQIYAAFNQYKRAVPVRGAVLLNPELSHCLLVRGWRERDAWGFPRGKLSRDEDDAACAAREVAEETGLDVSTLIEPGEYVEVDIGAQNVRLYIVAGVDMATMFAPTVRYEIGGFAWHTVADLPSTFDQDKRVRLPALAWVCGVAWGRRWGPAGGGVQGGWRGPGLGKAGGKGSDWRGVNGGARLASISSSLRVQPCQGWNVVTGDPSPGTRIPTAQAYVSAGGKRHRFFNVWQFVRPLQAWIAKCGVTAEGLGCRGFGASPEQCGGLGHPRSMPHTARA